MIERELKFELDLDRPVPRLDGVGPVARQGDPVKSVLEATYFDTADYRLTRARVTLRRRTGGHDAGWHLKLPRADGHRDEVTEPLGQPTEPVPGALRERIRHLAGEHELTPIARIRSTRYSYPLLDADDRPLATLTDDHVTAEASGEAAGLDTWREIEIELESAAGEDLLDVLGEASRHAGLQPAAWPSKLRRALRNRPGLD
ncbi:CYTH domain-containing protein [Prauserella shujinwangii]|uniref:CYTH domain-containing protein n=1 Tax=Prauserella shujinwangii TaxID=1453103 RepID=A0A2T0LSD1_9PSEU|nr:CYTH domain-containing protein [Prauserella shujinwangii]PRX46532.1 CYTH domain-containing protein [Prauserella shujinwangii]